MEETRGGYRKAKLCAWKSVGNYLEINKRRSDNECVKSQSQAEWSVAELDASINTLLSERRLVVWLSKVSGCLANWDGREKKCCTLSRVNVEYFCMHKSSLLSLCKAHVPFGRTCFSKVGPSLLCSERWGWNGCTQAQKTNYLTN